MHSSSSNRARRSQILIFAILIFTFYCLYNVYELFPSSTTTSTTVPIRDTSPTVVEKTTPVKEATPPPPPPNVCKTDKVLRNVDPNHTNAHLSFWLHLSENTVQVYKRRWQKFISSVKRTEIPSEQWEGRGIVLVAGNRDTFQRTLTAIQLLRHEYHCQLDIEVWHLSDEQPSTEMKQALERLRAVPKDLSNPQLIRPIINRSTAEKQFQIKAAAVINSSFKEILYLDSDNLPVQDPTFLFDTQEYKNTGALFWPDFWKTHGENKIFDVLNIPCEDEWEQESGQMVIDKEKSWLPLQLAWYMQKHYEIYFQFLNGDKDTFKYAWKALNMPFTMIESFVGMAGTMAGDRFCGHTMLQYFPKEDENDQLLFVHANLLKITDKRHFMEKNAKNEEIEHPWGLAKRSTLSYRNTYIKPEFYVTPDGRACMDFTHREGEPEAVTEDFDVVVPHFQSNYFKYGGIGGETRP